MSEKNTQSEADQLDVLNQLLKPEVQESLNILIEELPKLTELITLLNKSYDFAQSISTDEILKNDTVSAITELAVPVVESIKHVAATAIEAKDYSESNVENVGIFDLMRMLKDPQIQKLFRFTKAFLQISARKNTQK
ncbi:DUF1641 domain-containing protein [Psychrobacillus sp. NPDC096426]|uniref:DUF1641 domain-containing protein n=1 Tax=Psychrobacillus sp. NPDC096426 TaxID=3364491 RepID=UPI0037FDDE2D